jgi:uncharacterized membrane protein
LLKAKPVANWQQLFVVLLMVLFCISSIGAHHPQWLFIDVVRVFLYLLLMVLLVIVRKSLARIRKPG